MHELRHSRATLLFTLGVDAATVQRILRHSTITVTTGTYVEVIEAVSQIRVLFEDQADEMGSVVVRAVVKGAVGAIGAPSAFPGKH